MIAPEARLGNDIARQFAHLPRVEAIAAVVRHIETFWDPGMRASLLALVAAGDDTVDPLVADAARNVRHHVTRKETDAQP